MKVNLLFLLPLVLVLGSSDRPLKQTTSFKAITGNLNLTLKKGIWKEWEGKPVYQDLTLEVICIQGKCQPEVWGYAPKFNADVEQQGLVTVKPTASGYLIDVNLNIQSHPWQAKTSPAKYQIEIVNYKKDFIGNYTATVTGRTLQGQVRGSLNPIYPQILSSFQPLQPQEHPRLIFRAAELDQIKAKAKTPSGKAIIERLKKTLSNPIQYKGYVPSGGYHATGYCFLALLENNPSLAQLAWPIVEKSIKTPGNRIFEQAPLVAGVAMAYDLCYSNWTSAQRTRVTQYLAIEADLLSRGSSVRKGWNSSPASNWLARVKGASGLAALAIVGESELKVDPQRVYILAKRNLIRYLNTAIGEHGFGSEGDHYTTEPWVLTVLPFFIASRQVMGEDFTTDSNVEWFLPHYLTRIISQGKGKIPVATYGRHRYYAGGPLFAVGLGTVSTKYLPAVKWTYQASLGLEGDQSFGIDLPYQAVYALAALNDTIKPENPGQILPKVMVDAQKGFYVFRNTWQNEQDFVATIYVKHEALNSSWSFPDVGSFRISGLGENWAIPGPSEGKWENENLVTIPNLNPFNKAKTSFFINDKNGSGFVSLQSQPTVLKKEPVLGIGVLRAFAVDYSKSSGSPGLFAVVDQFVGSPSASAPEFQPKIWTFHTEGQVILKAQDFTVLSKNGTSLKATFISPKQVKLSYKNNVIQATGGDDFFVVMTVQKGEAPPIKITGTGLDALVRVGQQTINFDRGRLFFGVF